MSENINNKKRPNVISTMEENGIIYYFCDDGAIYKLDVSANHLTKIEGTEREKIVNKYKEKDSTLSDNQLEEK